MAKSIKVHQKRRGRPATGRDPAVTIRIPESVLAAVKEWAAKEGIDTRSAAIVRLVELGLSHARLNGRRKA
jgi:predicted DNA binding CopG/RHH family protein